MRYPKVVGTFMKVITLSGKHNKFFLLVINMKIHFYFMFVVIIKIKETIGI